MLEVLVNGCNGRMGQIVCDLIEQSEDFILKEGFDRVTTEEFAFPVYHKIEDIQERPDVIIDFRFLVLLLVFWNMQFRKRFLS